MTPRELVLEVIVRLGGKAAIYKGNPDHLIVVHPDHKPFIVEYGQITVTTIGPGESG